MSVSEIFAKAAHGSAVAVGRPWAFTAAGATVVVWAATGPAFDYSETWQLIINTGTTIITFLMVFLIQNAQNRDTRAIHLKLDELIRATTAAHNRLIALEDQSEETLDKVKQELAAECEEGSPTSG